MKRFLIISNRNIHWSLGLYKHISALFNMIDMHYIYMDGQRKIGLKDWSVECVKENEQDFYMCMMYICMCNVFHDCIFSCIMM